MAPRKRRSSRVRKAPPRGRSSSLTRADCRRLLALLRSDRNGVGALRDAVGELRRDSEIQFKRIAQLQAEVDEMKRLLPKSHAARG